MVPLMQVQVQAPSFELFLKLERTVQMGQKSETSASTLLAGTTVHGLSAICGVDIWVSTHLDPFG